MLQYNTFILQSGRQIASSEDALKIHSFIHFQLSVLILKAMLKYIWHASKLINEREVFVNMKDVCFTAEVQKNVIVHNPLSFAVHGVGNIHVVCVFMIYITMNLVQSEMLQRQERHYNASDLYK